MICNVGKELVGVYIGGGGARGVASHLKEDKLKRFNNCESWQGGVCQKLNFAIRFFSELLLLVL